MCLCNLKLPLLCDYGCSENEDTYDLKTKTRNEDPFMILIEELRVMLYCFTDEKQLKAWQLLFSQRGHSSV